jgi:hypothetical protein
MFLKWKSSLGSFGHSSYKNIFTTKSLIDFLYLGLQTKANIAIWRKKFKIFFSSLLATETLQNHFIFEFFLNFEYLFLTKFGQFKKKALRWQHLHASTCSSALG